MVNNINPKEACESAKILMKARQYKDVLVMLIPHVRPDQEDMKVYGILGNALIKMGRAESAITLLTSLHDGGRGNTVTTNTLGNAYLHNSEPAKAIAILKPLHDSGRGNTVTTNTLGNAYLHNGEPVKAIAILKPLHDGGRGNTVTAATLGNAYIHNSEPAKAIAILKPLHDGGRGDTVTTNTLGNAYLHNSEPAKAIAILKPLHDSGRGNTVTTNTLGNAYLHNGEPVKAIAILKPLHDSGRGDTVTAATLGNAYLHNGEPVKAIAILKPLHDGGRGNTVTTGTLGNAYAIAKDRAAFEMIKAEITTPDLADYLDAKLAYLEGDLRKARQIVQPYINHGHAPKNIIGLYMAAVPEENTVLHAQMRAVLGSERYENMVHEGNIWRENPLRAEAGIWGGHSSQSLFELGGVAVSRADNKKAGLGIETPVAVRRSSFGNHPA